MKRFVIKPATGRTTVSLTAHRYLNKVDAAAAGRERGTQVIYLGSFSSHIDPGRLVGVERVIPGDCSHGIKLKAGVELDDGPFELGAEDVLEIRHWLLANGSWARAERARLQARAERDREMAEERARLELDLRAELSVQLRQKLQAELERDSASRREHAVIEAIRAVEAAGLAVQTEASRLKAAGHRLSTRRGRDGRTKDAPVASLLELTLALRVKAFAGFEAACKEAKLMAGRNGSGASRKGAKAR